MARAPSPLPSVSPGRPAENRRRYLVSAGAVLALVLGVALTAASTPAGASPTWSLATSPNSGTQQNILPGVTCLSATDCVAVGYFENGDLVRQTLVESWNGSSWSIVSSPDQGTRNNELNALSCVSATWCQAVGDYDNGSGSTQNLVELWDGTSWSIVPSPDDGASSNSLGNVTCLTTMWCMAVGSFVDGGGVSQNLVEEWDGTSWSIVSSPDQGAHDNFLGNLSCTATTWCVAAGYDESGSAVTQTLVESWNGTAWSIVTTPDSGTGSNALTGVSCTSTLSCTAVGYDVPTSPVVPGGIHAVNLVESWNGTTWSIVPSPEEGTESNNFYDVSCPTSTSCVAVGSYYEGSGPSVSHTLVESWDGTSWTVVPSPDYGSTEAINLLLGVSCVTSGFCAAVGYHNLNTRTETLVETLPASGAPTALTTSLSGGGRSGTSISVPPGTTVEDQATLTGTDSPTATGTVTYTVYSDSACTVTAGSGGSVAVTAGSVPVSGGVALSAVGTYYWQASYSGGGADAPSASTCGPSAEVETVGPAAVAPESPAAVGLPLSAGAIGALVLVTVRGRERRRSRAR